MFESGGGGTRKTALAGLSRAPNARVGRGILYSTDHPQAQFRCFPRKKMNLGSAKIQFQIAIAFSSESRTRISVGLLSNRQNNSPHPPSLFLCKFSRITRPIFSKTGEVRPPDPPVAPQVLITLHLSFA